jgi:hypothetical protein
MYWIQPLIGFHETTFLSMHSQNKLTHIIHLLKAIQIFGLVYFTLINNLIFKNILLKVHTKVTMDQFFG